LYLEAIASGAIKKPEYKPKGGDRRTPKKISPLTPRRNFMKDPKAKAFLSAFKSFMCASDDSDDDGKANNKGSAVEDDDDNAQEENAEEDRQGFLSMIGSLKD
jgi:hypothetical protein